MKVDPKVEHVARAMCRKTAMYSVYHWENVMPAWQYRGYKTLEECVEDNWHKETPIAQAALDAAKEYDERDGK